MKYTLNIKDRFLSLNKNGRIIKTPITLIIDEKDKVSWEFLLRKSGAIKYEFKEHISEPVDNKINKTEIINMDKTPKRPSNNKRK